jgi:hypothetical protein
VKKIPSAVLIFVATSVFGIPRVLAQDAASQPAARAGSSADSFSDQQMALLRKDIRSIKKQLIAANLTLTEGEATKFWPVYEQYSAEFAKINDRRTALIKEYADGYGSLTDQQADSLIRRWLDTVSLPPPSARICPDLADSPVRKESRYVLSTRPSHQHDDRPAAYVATPARAKPGLICRLSAHGRNGRGSHKTVTNLER